MKRKQEDIQREWVIRKIQAGLKNYEILVLHNVYAEETGAVSSLWSFKRFIEKTRSRMKKQAKTDDCISQTILPSPEQPQKQEKTLEETIADIKTKKSLSDEISEQKQILNKLAIQDTVLSHITTAMAKMPAIHPPIPLTIDKKVSTEHAVILLGDCHIGEVVDIETTGGLGEYNLDMFKRRLQFLSDKMHSILLNKMVGYNFPVIHCQFLGDIFSGNIHQELAVTNELPIVDVFFYAVNLFSQFIADLAKNFPQVEIGGVVGNHSRMSDKKAFKQPYVNWDYMLYKTLEATFKDNPHVKFDIPKSFYQIKTINKKNFLFVHGDNIKSWAGVPFYGIQRAGYRLSELLNSTGRIIDYIALGHFHQLADLDRVHGGEIIINGSFVGTSEYSIGSMFTGSHPKQLLFSVHEKRGKTFSFPIDMLKPELKQIRYK